MKSSVNLLPMEFRRRSLMSVRARQWLVTFFICLLIVVGVIAVQWQRLKNQNELLAMLRAKAEPFQTMEQNLFEIQEELSQLHASRSLLAEAHRSTHTVKLLGLVSRSAKKNIQINSLEFKTTVIDAKAKEDSKSGPTFRAELILDGIAKDNLAISTMLAGLKSGRIFDSVEVLKISETTSNEKDLVRKNSVRKYSITCRIDEATR